MSEENTNATNEQTPVTPPSDETQNTVNNVQHSIPYDRFKQVNDQKNELQKRLEALEKAEQERQRAKLEAEGNYKQIIEALEPEAQRAKDLAETLAKYQERDQAELEAELEALDDVMRGLVPSGDASAQLTWVRNAKRAGLFSKPTPPKTDSGTVGDPKPPEDSNLTDAQKRLRELAKRNNYLRR